MKAKIIPFLCLLILFSCQKNDIEVYNGQNTSIDKLKGEWVVINYWADWCAPCIKELPELFEFAEDNEDIAVYVFNFDELDREDLAPVANKFKISLPSLISHPREIWNIQTPPAVPATFFINPEGELAKSLFRPQTRDSLNSILESVK